MLSNDMAWSLLDGHALSSAILGTLGMTTWKKLSEGELAARIALVHLPEMMTRGGVERSLARICDRARCRACRERGHDGGCPALCFSMQRGLRVEKVDLDPGHDLFTEGYVDEG